MCHIVHVKTHQETLHTHIKQMKDNYHVRLLGHVHNATVMPLIKILSCDPMTLEIKMKS